MEILPWIFTIVFALLALLQFTAAKRAYRKLNILNEYVQFIFFQSKVYNDHRDKFLGFVAENSSSSVTDQAMSSYQAIENMAIQLHDEIIVANVESRGIQ